MVHRSESRDHAGPPRPSFRGVKIALGRETEGGLDLVRVGDPPRDARPASQGSECRHPAKEISSRAIASPKMQKERPDEWKHPRFEIGRRANDVNVGKFRQGFASEMIENARAHVRRRFVESEYLNERDALLREHNPPRISCDPVNAETGFLGNLPPNVAIEVD